MSGFIEQFDLARLQNCLRKSPETSGNLAIARERWAQWWAHLNSESSHAASVRCRSSDPEPQVVKELTREDQRGGPDASHLIVPSLMINHQAVCAPHGLCRQGCAGDVERLLLTISRQQVLL